MTDETTPPACLGCVGCGGPDCIQRTTEPETAGITAEQWRKEAAAMGEQHLARRRQLARALHEPDGMPFASLIEIARLRHDDLATERAAHEGHRSAVCHALGRHLGLDWPHVIERVGTVTAAASERADLLTDARDALEAAGQTGAHGDDWPAVAPAIRALAAERDDLRKRADQLGELLVVAEQAGNTAEAELERARRGETEAIRARQAADADARHAMEQRQQMAAERYAWQQRGDRAEAALTRVRDAAYQLAALGTEAGARAAHAVLDALDGGSEQTAPDDADRIVAYRWTASGRLLCAGRGAQHRGWTPLASDDLPDGGICDSCGTDVLAEPETEPEAPCFHPVVQVDNGRRQCTGCGEWLDPEPQQAAEPQPIVVRLELADDELTRLIREAVRRFEPGGL